MPAPCSAPLMADAGDTDHQGQNQVLLAVNDAPDDTWQ